MANTMLLQHNRALNGHIDYNFFSFNNIHIATI